LARLPMITRRDSRPVSGRYLSDVRASLAVTPSSAYRVDLAPAEPVSCGSSTGRPLAGGRLNSRTTADSRPPGCRAMVGQPIYGVRVSGAGDYRNRVRDPDRQLLVLVVRLLTAASCTADGGPGHVDS